MKLARYTAGLVLLAALFYFRLIDFDELRKALAHPGLLTLTWLLCVLTIPIASLRWHILLRSQGLELHLWHTTRIVAMGAFFATFLPGSAGGDLVRGVYEETVVNRKKISDQTFAAVDAAIQQYQKVAPR